jgi:hypothetical protein
MFKHPGYRRLEYYKNKLLYKIERMATNKAKDEQNKAAEEAAKAAKALKELEEKGGS